MTQAVEQGVTVEVVRPEDGQRIQVGGPEEGEIVSTETQADGPTEAPKRHPLKHAWTFCFDNPNGKQKQSTWGSCIRAVYTFSTVEDFWCVQAKQDEISIWTKTASNEAAHVQNEAHVFSSVLMFEVLIIVVSIGKQWKAILDCNEKLGYLVHEDSKRLDKSAKPLCVGG
ncbi:unnamed protein product [Sphagnum balticum]